MYIYEQYLSIKLIDFKDMQTSPKILRYDLAAGGWRFMETCRSETQTYGTCNGQEKVDITTARVIESNISYIGTTPHPVTVTTRIISFLVGNPYKPSFVTVTEWGVNQNHTYIISIYIISVTVYQMYICTFYCWFACIDGPSCIKAHKKKLKLQ